LIQLKRELFENLDTLEGVQTALQNAVRLEHATIPTYLYALYSIKKGANQEIAGLIAGIVSEEMAHLALAANILNAIGGSPKIDDPTLLPAYPGPLPGGVDEGLTVPLEPLSIPLLRRVFMVIEHPENVIDFPKLMAEKAPQETIGMFYTKISEAIEKLGEGIFTGDPSKQVTQGFTLVEVIPVHDVASAQAAVETIIEQGEGTSQSPVDPDGRPGDLAHYWRFAEIVEGKQLVQNPNAGPDTPVRERWSFTGPAIPFDADGVYPLVKNPKVNDPKRRPTYAAGTTARILCDSFNYTYTSLLKSLEMAFTGQPEALPAAIGLMWSLEQQFIEMTRVELKPGDPKSKVAAPSFEYQPVNPGTSPPARPKRAAARAKRR
jgi:rubrerythrin